MNGTKRLIVVVVLLSIALWPRPLWAMDVQLFANMPAELQKHYLAFVVNEAEQLLIQLGERDQAERVQRLFHQIPPGSDRSLGVSQFESILTSTLSFVTNAPAPLQGTIRAPVEGVLSQVLINNGLELTRNFSQTLNRITRNRVFYRKPN
jgi:hypothetical protein